MILLNPAKASSVFELVKKQQDSVGAPNALYIVDVIRQFNTHDVNCPVLGRSFAYWEFMHACLDNILTNRWSTLPRMWIEYCCRSADMKLSESQAKAEHIAYLIHRDAILKKLNLPTQAHLDNQVVLHWVRNPGSERYMFSIAQSLVRIFIYFTQTEVDGIDNNASKEPRYVDTSFDAGDQDIWPIVSDINAFEVLED